MAKASALGSALLKCFNEDGDCKVIVEDYQPDAAGSESTVHAKCQRQIEFQVWSKLLCAWSDVFTAMFTHDFREKAEKKVIISGFSLEAVQAFLTFLYSEVLPDDPAVLVEVSALADKYSVQPLLEVCAERVEAELSEENACAMLLAADQVGSKTVKDRCLDQIFRSPLKTLPKAFVLSKELLHEVLTSTKLCIGDYELAMVILEWTKNPTMKTRGVNMALLLQQNVQLAALTEEQYSKVHSLADSLGLGTKVQELWSRRKRGISTDDFFETLAKMFLNSPQFKASETKKPAFLGYWINLIPSQVGFVKKAIYYGNANDKKYDNTDNKYAPAGKLEEMAMNMAEITLGTNDEVKWMMPHHAIYVSGLCFSSALGDENALQVFASTNGDNWDLLFDSELQPHLKKQGSVYVSCRTKNLVTWLKLCIRKGEYANKLKIRGILQVKP